MPFTEGGSFSNQIFTEQVNPSDDTEVRYDSGGYDMGRFDVDNLDFVERTITSS